jgi:hypothetical protein
MWTFWQREKTKEFCELMKWLSHETSDIISKKFLEDFKAGAG